MEQKIKLIFCSILILLRSDLYGLGMQRTSFDFDQKASRYLFSSLSSSMERYELYRLSEI